MDIISGDKFKAIPGITYRSMDELWAKEPPLPKRPYVLVSHGGDVPADEYRYILDDPNLIHWFATNAGLRHVKLTAIPVGLEYNMRPALSSDLNVVMNLPIDKTQDISLGCFAVHTWVQERTRCVEAMARHGMQMNARVSYAEYLREMRRSRFVLCPVGNGIDTFRFWEALYMGCIPIITRFINKERVEVQQYLHWGIYNRIPRAMIDSWDDFYPANYTEDIYNDVKLKSEILDFNYWRKLIQVKL